VVPPETLLGRPTSLNDVAGTVMYRNNGRRMQYAVVTPSGEPIGQAASLGLTPAVGQPITMVGVNLLIVGFANDTDLDGATAFFRQNGLLGEVRQQALLRNVYTVRTPSALAAFQAGDALGANQAVRFAHPDMYAAVRREAPVLQLRLGMTDIASGGMLDFGTTTRGMAVTRTLTITNTGDEALTVDVGSVPNGFFWNSPTPLGGIAPGESYQFNLLLTAENVGSFSGNLEILNNSATNPYIVALEGEVDPTVGPANLRVSVNSATLANGGMVSFGSTVIDAPVIRTFQIHNDGADDLTFGAVTVPPGYTVVSQPVGPVAGGTSTVFSVQLNATTGGTFAGTLTFLNNDADDNPFIAALTGTVGGSGGGEIEDPLFENQWHLANTGQGGGVPTIDINVEPAWLRTFGNGAIVGIMDDGTQPEHPDYAGNLLACDDCVNQFDFDINVATDDGSHGTAVAGLVGAVANSVGGRGVAPETGLIVTSFFGSSLDQANNFAAVAAEGASVHTNSWSKGVPTYLPDVLRDTIIDLTNNARGGRGMLFLFASSNRYSLTLYGSALASMEETLGVGAVTNEANRSPYSNYGLGTDLVGPSNFGTLGIVTTDVTGIGGYNPAPSEAGGDYTSTFGGTSAATPIVAGIAGLVMAVNPELHAAQLKRLLMHTANQNTSRNDLLTVEHRPFNSATSFSESYGYGLANADAAVQAALNSLTNGTLTWPAPATDVTVNQAASMTTVSWTNPVAGPKGEYSGALLVRMSAQTWKPTDGVVYTVGQSPALNVLVLAAGDLNSFQDTSINLSNNANYAIFIYNEAQNYSFGTIGVAAKSDGTTFVSDSFEVATGWVANGDWERGTPDQNFVLVNFRNSDGDIDFDTLETPPRTRGFNQARTGASCFATGLASTYLPGTSHELFSPVIDLVGSNARNATLTYWELIELESNNPDTFVRVDVVSEDLANPSVITQLRSGNPGNSYIWTLRSHDLTGQIGTRFRLRFTLTADNPLGTNIISQFQGWFLDDYRISLDGTIVAPPPGSRRPGLVRLPPPGGFLYFPFGTAPTVPVTRSPDVNSDGNFDTLDVGEVLKRFGATADQGHFDARYDFNDDGRISMFDLGIVLVVALDPSSYTPDPAPIARD
jgi:subtilisin family serine protease